MTSDSSSLLREAILDTNNHLQLGFTRDMHPILSQLRCWVSSEDADNATVIVRSEVAQSKEVGFCSTGPRCAPFPHFHEEACAYIRGHTWVESQLPGVKAKALKMARRSASRAVPLEPEDASPPEGRGESLSRPREQSQKAHQRMLQALRTPYRRTTGISEASLSPAVKRRSFLAMEQHEIHQDLVSHTSANSNTPKPSSANIGTAITTSGRYPVYDGLRSSPPTAHAGGPHIFKPYTGPFFSPPPPSPEPEDGSEFSYAAGQPSPLLQYATLGRRATATVIDNSARPIPIPPRTTSLNRTSSSSSNPRHSLRLSTARPLSPFPPLPPLPSPIHFPFPEGPTSNPNPNPNPTPPDTPIDHHHHNNNNPPSPSGSSSSPISLHHHYTTPEAHALLTAVKTHLELPTTDASSLPPAELLASLLFRWSETRRGFRQSAPALADQVDETISWVGVEGEFPEEGGGESFVRRLERRLVEEWLREGGGRVFGGWEPEVGWVEGNVERRGGGGFSDEE